MSARAAAAAGAMLRPAAMLAGALAVSALIVLLAGKDPVRAMGALFEGAFGSTYGFLNVWTKACPLLLTGLAVLVAFRAGFWNIGAEGQLILGAIAAAWIGTASGLPAGIHSALALLGAFAAGAGWCLIAAWLRVRRGTFEVIATILLNFVALYLLSWLVHGPLMQASGAQPIGDPVAASAVMPRLFGRGYTLHAGLVLALAAAAIAHLALSRTETGFRLRAVGLNPRAAAWAGIPVERSVVIAAAFSGGIAGVAGGVEILGVLGRLYDKVSPGYGFTAIAVALLARLRPLALIPAALFFGALEAGSSTMQQEAGVSRVLVLVIQAVVILASIGTGLLAREGALMDLAAGMLEAAVRIALPILLVVTGEIVAERSGVLNIGLEGMILAGAFGGFAGAWATGSPWVGLLAGVAAALLLAALFAQLVVRWALDPIVSGVALNILALGVTGVLFRALTEASAGTVFVTTFTPLPVPGLSKLPLVGAALFSLNALGYAAVALAVAASLFLGRTAPGLVLRAAGENPEAVETAGGNVARVRTLAVLFGGAMAGAAGVYLSCGYSDTFVENMSAGRGFVALAIVVFARWSPLGGAAGALLFGLAMSLQVRLQGRPVLGAEIPYQFFQMLPYALTLLVLATTSRRGAGAPAALARPWRRER